MVEPIADMPPGTHGFRLSGRLTRDEYFETLDPMRHAIAAFGWLSPGELRVFKPGELEQAKAWTGGADG